MFFISCSVTSLLNEQLKILFLFLSLKFFVVSAFSKKPNHPDHRLDRVHFVC